MTDTELVNLIAEKIMGWEIIHDKNYCESVGAFLYIDNNGNKHFMKYDMPNVYSGEVGFDPLNNYEDAFQIIDRMQYLGWNWSIENVDYPEIAVIATFLKPQEEIVFCEISSTVHRSICLASFATIENK